MYDTETGKASQLKSSFVDIDGTIGKPEDSTYDQFKWLEVDYAEKFFLEDLSGKSISNLADRLFSDEKLAREFQFNKMGIDTSDIDQVK